MNKINFFCIISILLFLFSIFFFISNIEECATDEEVLLSITSTSIEKSEKIENTKNEEDIILIEKVNDSINVQNKVNNEDENSCSIEEEQNKTKEDKNENEHKHTKITMSEKANCYAEGYEKTYCDSCGYVFEYNKIVKTEHDWEKVLRIEATPIENGKILYRCRICYTGKDEIINYEKNNKTNLYIPSINLNCDVVIAECNQQNTDKYDICCDMDFIDNNNPLFFGHNTGTLKNLYKVKVGDIIYFTYNNEIRKYKVIVSEEGYLYNGGTDIVGKETDTHCISILENETLHFFTCYQTVFNPNGRWIVLAERIS